MRLATWNILSGRAVGADAVDVAAFREAVRSLDPDVLALQEVDRSQPRSQRLDLAAIAAQAMGAVDHRFVPALIGPRGAWHAATGFEEAEVPAYGVALLSRLPVSSWEAIRLPGAPLPVPHRSGGRRRLVWDEPRVAVAARIEAPAGPLDVVATHLSYLRPWNTRQLRRLMTAIRERSRPLVLMGDLNLGPRPVARLTGLSPLATGATFPAHAPVMQIDHLLGDGISSIHAGVVRLAVSDHRALVADL
ncbi:MAG: endonuclease/exonuclease/phosphatase family protein [Nocardioides sp.]|nr:endonuclease/exonuclease/phosphatase family protein [Nocardioides sp.]